MSIFFLGGGGTYTSVYTYVYTHTHTHTHTEGSARCILFNGIKNHIHACSMYIRFSFRIMMKTGQWQSIVMYVMRGRYVCGMIVV